MEEPKMNKRDILNNEQITKLRSLGITRNIKNLYDLECWLLMFIEIQGVKYFLRLETVSINSSRKTIKAEELGKIKNWTHNHIYYRYSYVNHKLMSSYGEKIYHLSKIDAIIYIMEIIIDNSEKPNSTLYKNIVNKSDIGEFFNSKKFNALDNIRQTLFIEREYQKHYVKHVDADTYLTYLIKIYQFTIRDNFVFIHFLYDNEDTKFTRFNLYQITENDLKHNINMFKQIFKDFDNKHKVTEYHDKDAQVMKKIVYCTSGMNIYYINYELYCSYRLNILRDEDKYSRP